MKKNPKVIFVRDAFQRGRPSSEAPNPNIPTNGISTTVAIPGHSYISAVSELNSVVFSNNDPEAFFTLDAAYIPVLSGSSGIKSAIRLKSFGAVVDCEIRFAAEDRSGNLTYFTQNYPMSFSDNDDEILEGYLTVDFNSYDCVAYWQIRMLNDALGVPLFYRPMFTVVSNQQFDPGIILFDGVIRG